MTNEEIEKILNDHEKRILGLEKIQPKRAPSKMKEKDGKTKSYAGPKGGIILLLERGYLANKKTAADVHSALDAEGYVYVKDVVQTALNRLSNPKGPLVKIEEGGKKVYVQRK